MAGSRGGGYANPVAYEYDRAARDALTFAALFDRFIQNLRRYLGYHGSISPPSNPRASRPAHSHRDTRHRVPRRTTPGTRRHLPPDLVASHPAVKYCGDQQPVWDEATGTYLDPATGEVLPAWDQALDAIGADDEPWHVARFGDRFDAQGVLSGSKDAGRCIGYLTKYLTKQVADCHQAQTDAQRVHAGKAGRGAAIAAVLAAVRELAPLRHPAKNARPGLVPAAARARPTMPITSATPGAGSWSPASGPARPWPTTAPTGESGCRPRSVFRQPTRPSTPGNPSHPTDPDHMEHTRRLLHAVADRARWQAALNEARRRASPSGLRMLRLTGRAA